MRLSTFIKLYQDAHEKRLDYGEQEYKAKEALREILLNMRKEIKELPDFKKINFTYSSFSDTAINFIEEKKAIMAEDILSIINTMCIFILADLDNVIELETFLNNVPELQLKDEGKESQIKEIINFLGTLSNKEPLAILYQSLGELDDSLRLWKEIKGDRGAEKTIQILSEYNLSKDKVSNNI